MRAALTALAVAALSAMTTLLLAGHGPWSGHLLWQITADHGLNTGDVPVLLCWLLGTAAVLALARR